MHVPLGDLRKPVPVGDLRKSVLVGDLRKPVPMGDLNWRKLTTGSGLGLGLGLRVRLTCMYPLSRQAQGRPIKKRTKCTSMYITLAWACTG